MFKEITIQEFAKNGITAEESYSDTEMSFSVDEGSIIYKSTNNTFLISDYTFWEPVSLDTYKELYKKIKASLVNENKPFAIRYVSTSPGFNFFGFDFVNVPVDRVVELHKIFNEVSAFYDFSEGNRLKSRKSLDKKPWFRNSFILSDEKLTISFNPETISLSLARSTSVGEKIIIDLKQSGDVLNELFNEVADMVSIKLAASGINCKTQIDPFGFRIDIRSKKEDLIFDFEMYRTDDNKIQLVVNEYLEDEGFRTTSTPFFEEWSENLYINFDGENLVFEDNGLLNVIIRRQLTSHFSFL